MDNGMRKHWVIYYEERKSLVTGQIVLDEVIRKRISAVFSLSEMIALARTNAPAHCQHFRIARAREPQANLAVLNVTGVLPCR